MRLFKTSFASLLAVVLLFSLISNASADGGETLSFDVNENGETYGNYFQAESIGEDPDLIYAQGEDGTLGYVRATDLEEPMPESPEAALANEAEQRAAGYEGHYINLYASDGVTVIGRFFIKAGYLGASSNNSRSGIAYSDPTTLNTPNYTFTAFSTAQQVWNGITHSVIINAPIVMPTGYLGGKTQLFNADTGALVDASNYDYSDDVCPNYTVSKTYITTSGTYYAKGIACIFDDGTWGRFSLYATGYCDVD